MKLLFVCSGNVCRSPMAEVLCRRAVEHAGISGWVIASAGTLGLRNVAAAPEAIEALREVGVELGGHRSRGIGVEEILGSDWIVAMAREHVDYLERQFVQVCHRVHLLRAFEHAADPSSDAPDLADPIGEPVELYREQRELIVRCVENLIAHAQRSR